MSSIPEKDWKLLRAMKDEKLNQACGGILERIEAELKNKGKENHKAYLEVWEVVNSSNREIAEMFDDLRRSNAVLKLASWRRYGLLTEKELNEFSEETRSTIEAIASY